jgi:ligand-binding sensor domain-containing protein
LSSIAIDSLQNIYFGTYDFGFVKKQASSFSNWNTSNSLLPDDIIHTVTVERNGIIWLGTNSHGVVRFDENMWSGDKEIEKGQGIALFPVPCISELQVSSLKGIEEISIVDVLGKNVFYKAFPGKANSETINLSSLSSGIYFLLLRTGQESRLRRFIKE